MHPLADIEEHIPALRRYAFSLVGRATGGSDADDIVQASLLKAMDRLETGGAVRDLRPWLFSIVHNVFVSHWRRERVRRAIIVDKPDADVAVRPPQEDDLALAAVMRRLDRLPEAQRQVLLLVAVEEVSYAEAAEILDVPIGTVMSRLSRARDGMARNGFQDGDAWRRDPK